MARPRSDAFRAGGLEAKAAREHASERTRRCVSERADAPTPASADPRRRSCGGEGGIRTRGAFAHRFSRAAPSTTRTPLRGRGYQTRVEPGPEPRRRRTRQATGAATRREERVGLVATDAADDLDAAAAATSCWASWMTVPAAPLRSFGEGVDEGLDVALEERPDAHRARLEGGEDRGIGQAVGAQLSGGLAEGVDRPRGPSGRSPPGPGHGPGRPSRRRRRRRPRWAARREPAPGRASASASPMKSS